MIIKFKVARAAAHLLAFMTATTLASAQTVTDTADAPNTGLDLPKDLTTFGNVNPNIRKATAIVNGDVITDTDIEQRLALIALANGGKIPDGERDRLRLQVLRNLIDEKLQIQEASAHDVTIAPEEINQSFDRVAERFKRTPAAMREYLHAQGSSERSIKQQIHGELAWSRLLRRRVEPYINVSEEEVQGIMARLEASKGTKEYHVGEIYMAATPDNGAEIQANESKIIDQLRGGGSFAAYARQFSESSSAGVGGDLGWLRAPQLPDALAAALPGMSVGQIAGPIAVQGGFSLLYLVDTRQVLTADPRDATLNLRQLSLKFPAGTTQPQATAKAEAFAKATQAMGGCGKASDVAAQFGAEMVDNDQVRVRDLPPQLQDMMIKATIGQATAPFGSATEGIRVLVVCGRDDPQDASDPSADAIRTKLEEAKVNLRAQRYLRDLRRDAVVEYR